MNDNHQILFDISKEDYNASKLLFENKFYPQSLFYFQQSVEKSIKYLGLRDEIIIKEDLAKNISHRSSIIFKNAMIKYQYLNSSDIDYNINNEHQELRDIIKQTSDDKIIAVISKNIFDTLKNLPDFPFDINKIEKFEDLYKILKKINPNTEYYEDLKLLDKNESYKPLVKKKLKEFVTEFIDYTKGVKILYLLNIISESLVSSTRYPDIDNMINPSKRYNSEHPFVKELPNLYKALEYSLETIIIK